MIELKNVYRGDEVKFVTMFRNLQAGLLGDFLQAHPDFQQGAEFSSVNYYNNPTGDNSRLYSKEHAWKVSPVKSFKGMNPAVKDAYPTAYNLVKEFGSDCVLGCYSIFEPNTILYRHTGVENRDAKHIRIHIPLYVPEGDIGFEVEGEVVLWDDVFSFNNQKLHSGWNHTNERRLVFLLDLSRELCDLPPAPVWYPGANDNVPVFEKTRDHALL